MCCVKFLRKTEQVVDNRKEQFYNQIVILEEKIDMM